MFVEREVPAQQCVELLTARSCTDLPQTPRQDPFSNQPDRETADGL
jgi:hypothetical protein